MRSSDKKGVAPDKTTIYILRATNEAGISDVRTVTVTVEEKPVDSPKIISFAAVPARISAGGTSTLSWEVSGATSVTIDGIGKVRSSDKKGVAPDKTTIYTLTATNEADKSIYSNVTITVRSGPDLVVTSLKRTGSGIVNSEGQFEVPIQVVVKNQGDTEAGIFKVSTEYTYSRGTFAVPFTVPRQNNIWYPYTKKPLLPGGEVMFEGTVTISTKNEKISLTAIADSCSGDEFMPKYCRIKESNEINNKFSLMLVTIPSSRIIATIPKIGIISGT